MNVGTFGGEWCWSMLTNRRYPVGNVLSVSTLNQLRKFDLALFLCNGIHMTYLNIGEYEKNVTSLFM